VTTPSPLVSLCVPTYGRAAFLGTTLESAFAQTVPDFEVIVVNDCSPDETARVVAQFNDSRLRYVENERNLGVPENLNRAMGLARGEFMVLLEDHDILEPTYLEETLAVMSRHPSVGVVATGLVTIDQDGIPQEDYLGAFPEFVPGRQLVRRLLTRHDCPFSVTTLVRRAASHGLEPLFDSRYGWYADQYLWLRLLNQSDFGYVPRKLLRFRLRESDHYLIDREWDSLFRLDRLHRDNWSLLHANRGLRSMSDRLLFEKAKLREIIYLKMRRRSEGQPWTAADVEALTRYLPSPSRHLTRATDLLPSSLLRWLRRMSRRRYRHRRAGAVLNSA